jgi:long-chain acyl-CoA synthetase
VTVCELFRSTAERHRDREALRMRGGEGSLTWGEYDRRVRELAAGLAAHGLRRGDRLALMLVNRPEFHLVDTAAMHLGAVPFSLYNSSSPEQLSFLLGDASPRILVTEKAFLPALDGALSGIEHLFVVDGAPALRELAAAGDAGFDFDAAWQAVQPDDLLTLIYTSGTTGPPKGVQITHANYLAELRAFRGIDDFRSGRLVSYFPMAHVAERVVSHYNAIAYGHTVTCCPDPREVIAYLPEVRPTFFFAVPRIWEKLKAAIEAAPGEGDVRSRFGLDETAHVLTGAAPATVEVLEFFRERGLEILEVWGLSETTGLATANLPGRAKLGTVGPAADGVELRIADDREVLVRGGIVTPGYRNAPAQSADAIDGDGWFRTGDVGELDDEGYLRIVDRKKELIINAAGENMSPANIEAQLRSASTLIAQACVIGDRRPYNVALIVPEADARSRVAGDGALEAAIEGAVHRANARLSRPEQIKRFRILGADWSPGGEEVTPTLKLKRARIAERYAGEIDSLYV